MKCFLYCRKSSEDQARQVQSITDQKSILLELAKSRNLEIVEIFSDEKSAGTPYQRMGFQAMMQRIQAGEAVIILTWKIDRLSRNPIENGQISWMLQQGIIKEIITPDRVYLPEDNVLLYMVEGAMANQYLRDLSGNVKRGMQSKVERGLYPSHAPIGYLNEGKHKGSKYIIPDPMNFHKIQVLWDLLKTKQYQLAELYRIMREKYPIYKNGKLLAFSTFHRIFHNSFYCGLFHWGGKVHLGVHQAMLTQGEFEMIQDYLNNDSKPRQRELVFDFKGVFRCGTCDAMITAERKHKFIKSDNEHRTFDYYRCAHRRRNISCNEKPLSKVKIDFFLQQEIQKICLPQQVISHALHELKKDNSKESESSQDAIKIVEQEIRVMEDQLKTVESNLAFEPDAEIRAMIKQKHTDLKVQIQRCKEDKVSLLEHAQKRNNEMIKQLKIIGRAETILFSGDQSQKKELLDVLGSNWQIKGQNLHYKPNFVCEAINKVRKIMPDKFAVSEPKETHYASEQTLSNDEVVLIWSALWELIRN